MSNYNDYRVWKEVELFDHTEYLSEYHEYQPEDILEISAKLLSVAKEERLQGCYLTFRSSRDPYEDTLGPVALAVCGYRKLTSKEKTQLERNDVITALSKEKGISFYEAATLLDLKERGKL